MLLLTFAARPCKTDRLVAKHAKLLSARPAFSEQPRVKVRKIMTISPTPPPRPGASTNLLAGAAMSDSQAASAHDPSTSRFEAGARHHDTKVPASLPNRGAAWTRIGLRRTPRLAFSMFVVVACAPSAVVIALPATLYALGAPPLSGLILGLMAIALTWGCLAILMRYQENWESAPPPPRTPWAPGPAPLPHAHKGVFQ